MDIISEISRDSSSEQFNLDSFYAHDSTGDLEGYKSRPATVSGVQLPKQKSLMMRYPGVAETSTQW